MALMRLKRSQDDEPLTGQEVLGMRQSIRDQNAAYDAAHQAVDDWKAQNGGEAYDLPDSLAVTALKSVKGGAVGQPKYVTDPQNPDNWERWSPQYKWLTGQSDYNPFDDDSALTQSLEAATGAPSVQGPKARETNNWAVTDAVGGVQTATVEPKPTDDMYAESLAKMTTPTTGSAALGVPTDANGYPQTGGQYNLSQYTPAQIEAAKNALVRSWQARSTPVESYVIDMNKGTVNTNAANPQEGWASALMGDYGQAQQTGEGQYNFTPAPRASAAASEAWARQFIANGGQIGGTGTNPSGGTSSSGGSAASSSTASYQQGQTSPYTQTGGAGQTPVNGSTVGGSTGSGSGTQSSWTEPVTAWNGEGRPSFAYTLNGDPLYQMYRDLYMKNGERAMNDTMARASALTGGYGNSYAQAAGQNAYNQYLDQLNDVALTLYNTAYSRYRDDMGDYWKQYQWDYQKGRDAINDARYLDELLYNRAWNENERTYTRGRQAVIDQREANNYYLQQVDYDNQYKQSANTWAVNYASLFGSEEELLGALRNQFASTVDDGVLAQIAHSAFTGTAKLQGEQATAKKQEAYTNATNAAMSFAKNYYSEDEIADRLTGLYGAELSPEEIRRLASDAVNAFTRQQSATAKTTTGGNGSSGTKSQTMSANQRTTFDQECRGYAAEGDYAALENTINDYYKLGYLTYDEAVQKYNYYANLPKSELSKTADYAGFFSEIGNINKNNGGVTIPTSTISSLAKKYNIDENEAYSLINNGQYTSNTVNTYGYEADDARADAFRNYTGIGQKNVEQEFMNTGSFTFNGKQYDDLSEAIDAINAELDAWVSAGRINEADANFIRYVAGIDEKPMTPTGQYTQWSVSQNQQTSGEEGNGNGLKFASDMKASDAKSVEDKLKAAESQNEAGRILNSWSHVLSEAEYNRLWDKYVEGFVSPYSNRTGGR